MSRYQIHESKLRESAEAIMESGASEPKGLLAALEKGEQFKASGLTPFYVYDEHSGALYVTSEEHVENKLN